MQALIGANVIATPTRMPIPFANSLLLVSSTFKVVPFTLSHGGILELAVVAIYIFLLLRVVVLFSEGAHLSNRTTTFSASTGAVQLLKDATNDGRLVIPFLGAGLSAASGFPLINDLRDYLCKVKFLIEGGVYRHFLGERMPKAARVQQGPDSPQFHPAHFIDCFGWPHFNQLDADLWWYFIDEFQHAQAIQPGGKNKRRTQKLVDEFRQKELTKAFAHHLKKNPKTKWGQGRWAIQSAVHRIILEDLQFHDSRLAEKIVDDVLNLELTPRIDWFRFMLDLAAGRRGLIDSLFSQLNYLRQPSLGHLMLAQLASEFGWRLHLTINFDTLLETSFRREGLNPTVFEVSRETSPPDPTLVNRTDLSLIKLHGGSFDLRIGESIDHSLDDSTRKHVLGCIPDDALLLVIGFSGYERRMMQLIEELALRGETGDKANTRVLWMHWEEEQNIPATVRRLEQKLDDVGRLKSFQRHRLSDAGLFLLETYQTLSSTLPFTIQTYSVLPKRITFQQSPGMGVTDAETTLNKENTFHLFASKTIFEEEVRLIQPGMILESTAPSLEMSAFVQTVSGFHIIWIDLEDHHTVSGIVGEIIQKMRSFDPHLPHLVLPVDDKVPTQPYGERADRRFEKATRYIRRAIRRGKYVFAFDAIEGFGREQTAHHGLPVDLRTSEMSNSPSSERETRLKTRLSDLIEFLTYLIAGDRLRSDAFSDWHCCFAVDDPSNRHIVTLADQTDVESCPQLLTDVRASLATFCQTFIENKLHDCDYTFVNRCASPKEENTSEIALSSNRPLYHFRNVARMLNAAKDEADVFLSGISHSGFGADSGYIDESLSPVLDPSITPRPAHAVGVFLVLSAFRRPRTIASVYSVLSDLYRPDVWHADATDADGSFDSWCSNSLDLLQQSTFPLLRSMDGGFLWIPHHLHQWTYKLLSEPARHQCADASRLNWISKDWPTQAKLKTDTQQAAPRTKPPGEVRLTRLIQLIVIHSRIARFYFMHVYRRSHDIAGLHEYLYHRMSSLKYLTTLRHLLHESKDKLKDNQDSIIELDKAAVIWCIRDGLIRRNDAKASLTVNDAVDLAARNYLQRLLNVLKSEEPTIVSKGIADTWLSWVEMLLSDIVRLRIGFHATRWNSPRPILDEVQWTLNRLKAQLLREKGGRKRCAAHLLTLMYSVATVCTEEFVERLKMSIPFSGNRDDLMATVGNWRSSFRVQQNDGQPEVSLNFEVNSALQLKHRLEHLITFANIVFRSDVLALLLLKRNELDIERISRETTRFFWCYRNCCACLRHYEDQEKVKEWLEVGARWMKSLNEYLESTIEPQGNNKANVTPNSDVTYNTSFGGTDSGRVAPQRALMATLQEQTIEYEFDRLRYGIEAELSRPFTRGRYDAFGKKLDGFAIEVADFCQRIASDVLSEKQRSGLVANINELLGKHLTLPVTVQNVGSSHVVLAKAIEQQYPDARDKLEVFEETIKSRMGNNYPLKEARVVTRSIWDKAEEFLDRANSWRLSVFGVDFADTHRSAHSQCEFRLLVAECLAFKGEYVSASRELRLAVSALDRDARVDKFHQGIAHGFRSELFLLQADSHLRRKWDGDGGSAKPHPRMDRGVAILSRNRAREDLKQAASCLEASQNLIKDFRWNVNRWEWLYELRAQLVIERLLLCVFELDFEIDVSIDDWRLVGAIQRELTEGLEAIRAAMDCTVYPHHLAREVTPVENGTPCDTDDTKHLHRLHRRLLGLWMELMVASFWVLRFLSVGNSTAKNRGNVNRFSPRLAAMERFAVSGSMNSFWNRWSALNQAAGLNRFVETSIDFERSSRARTRRTPGEVVRESLGAIADVGTLLSGTDERPPAMLREFVLQKMTELYGKHPTDSNAPVRRFQAALMNDAE
jgi:hypothetical protein